MGVFLSLSLLSGMIELGVVFLGLGLDIPTYLILFLPLSYQTGNLVASYMSKAKKRCLITFLVGISFTAINFFQLFYLLLIVQIACCSSLIQVARLKRKRQCPTWVKRLSRVIGFTGSPLLIWTNGQVIILLSLVICLLIVISETNQNDSDVEHGFSVKRYSISYVMLFHQMHYFVYVYIMPMYVYHFTNSVFGTAVLFAGTWITYLLPHAIVGDRRVNYKKLFIWGHTFLAVCLFIMGVAILLCKPILAIIAWLLTGFGGGTVFCIKRLEDRIEVQSMEYSENLGHVLGAATACILCMVSNLRLYFFPMLSVFFVLIAMLMYWKINTERKVIV